MKYVIFNGTKTIELNDELVKVYEENVHPINEVVLQGFIAGSDAEEKNENEMKNIIINAMLETLELYTNIDDTLNKVRKMATL